MDTFWWIDKLSAIAVEPAPECLTQTFVLASSSWVCERSLWGPLLRALRFPFGCAVFCGLVPVCGSVIVRRSSRSPSGFGVSLPVAWSHPTFVRYKASYPRCFYSKLSLFLNLLPWRSGQNLADSYRYLSCGNQSYCCHGRFCYHPPIYLSICYWFHPSYIVSCSYPIVH
jgi:hypothetical protein